MKIQRCCRIFLIFLSTIVTAGAQGLGDYIWTNVVAFPGLTFSAPVALATPPRETNRLFVVQAGGSILVISNLDIPNTTTFLNLSPRVSAGLESGLLGMAFHPGYATNGFFYVFYTYATNFSSPPMFWDVLSRFHTSVSDPNKADAASEVPLFVQRDRAANHNGGDLHFGPDGYLYVSVGDEGMENNALHQAQLINSNLFSGILRLDVDKLPGSRPPNPSPTAAVTTNYAIPPDNPFIGATSFDGLPVDPTQVRTEFWAVGLRNPWRFCFDPVTGFLYCGDVGEDSVEEINVIKKGGNYGWAAYEGTNRHSDAVAENAIPPTIMYYHGNELDRGDCVIGGVVYRGTRFPQLTGAYIFGDWQNPRIWGSFYDGTNATVPVFLAVSSQPRAFGTDPRNGDVLYVDNTSVKRLIPFTPVITSLSYFGTNVVVGGAGGRPGKPFVLESTSDVSQPMTNWLDSKLGFFDPLANFIITNAVDPAVPQMFFRVR